ncbi:MAG: DUF1931 domain-containing protein [Promethearchaeota archaeon]|jgi:histone H3/H4
MAKKPAVETLFVKSKVKEYIKSKGCNTASEVLDGNKLNSILIEILEKAVTRAKANNRKTVQERDL